MSESEEKLRYIIDTLRINYAFANPYRDKSFREKEVIKRMGKGWGKTNLHYFKKIVEYDILHENEYKFSLGILEGQTTIGEVLKLVDSEGNYTDLDELESYLYITALCNIKTMEPLDNLRKIGRGDDYRRRMRSLTSDINKKYLSGTKGPYGYVPVRLWKGKTDTIIEAEKCLHTHLYRKKYYGEFFEMDFEFYDNVDKIISGFDVEEMETVDVVNGHDKLIKDFSIEELYRMLNNEEQN
jgi:hypothetical protein